MIQYEKMLHFQKRLVAEKLELDEKRRKLNSFIESDTQFLLLHCSEQERLRLQLKAMTRYSDILDERILAFQKEK